MVSAHFLKCSDITFGILLSRLDALYKATIRSIETMFFVASEDRLYTSFNWVAYYFSATVSLAVKLVQVHETV